ncbi:MAG: hypothetical protein K0S98_564 [Propionibacteriaceae bacterium]|jgi:hypothetical protein|nr:hypothetical protein [Propionibacteriaceae bacterium]
MSSYPVHVDAHLDAGLSRWLWLVKWVLAIPHCVVLAFLWLAFAVLSVVAFFAILITGRYPKTIFDFNVGVLRWSWRVSYYTYGALGTDRYPPFTLQEVPDYPAHLEIDYPDQLSRGLVLIKWWLLAIPHYLILAFFLGGGLYVANEAVTNEPARWVWGGGLIGLLVLIAAVVLLFTGRYPRPIYDLVLGLNRWVLRVAGYAGLMTDQYPPFRLDLGESEDRSQLVLTASTPTQEAELGAAQPGTPVAQGAVPTMHADWTAGRIVALILGSLLLVASAGIGIGGATLAVANATSRDDAGFLMSERRALSTDTYAIASSNLRLADGPAAEVPERWVGTAKVQITSQDASQVFLGIAATRDAEAYLRGVAHATVVDIPPRPAAPVYSTTPGSAPQTAPTDAQIWVAQSVGAGTHSVTFPLESGDWTVVVMNADGQAAVSADLAVGATVPGLRWLVAILLSVAGTGLLIGVVLVVAAVQTARTPTPMQGEGVRQAAAVNRE